MKFNRYLVKNIYTADPSAHVFNGKLYIYPSHDIDGGVAFNDNGDHFCMRDYHVFSVEEIDGEVTDHGMIFDVDDVAWAERQLWAPDAIEKKGKYYFYFPGKDYDGVFRIGVAVGDHPQGPFVPQPEAIKGSYSIDPAVFKDDDGSYYLYFGGIWGGQLQDYRNNERLRKPHLPEGDEAALLPKVAKLREDMFEFDEDVRDVEILDEHGNLLLAADNERRFFEGAWMHKYQGKYYFSYSTGDTHLLCYATGDNPYGPFTYQGVILTPVVGWTTHHSICKFKGKWYLFYHDSKRSNGVTHLRSIKVAELSYNEDGSIQVLDGMAESTMKLV